MRRQSARRRPASARPSRRSRRTSGSSGRISRRRFWRWSRARTVNTPRGVAHAVEAAPQARSGTRVGRLASSSGGHAGTLRRQSRTNSTRTARRCSHRCAERAESLDTPRTTQPPSRLCEPPSARTASCRCSEHVAGRPSRTSPARSVSRHRRSGATSSDCPTAAASSARTAARRSPGPRLADIIDPAAPAKERIAAAGRGAGQGWLHDRRRERLDDAGLRPAPRRPRGPDRDHERPRRRLDAGRSAGHRSHRPRRRRSGRACTACSVTSTEMAIARAAGRRAVRRHRRDQPRHGLMNDSVPEIVSDRALRRMARTLRRPRRRAASSTWSRRPTSSGSTRSTRSSRTTRPRPETVAALRERGVEVDRRRVEAR